jgi:hypothetical protein
MASPPPEPENPVLKLNAREILDFIEKQSKSERDFFDRLLKWFGGAVAAVIAVAAFFGIQNACQVKKLSDDVRDAAKRELRGAVEKEITQSKIEEEVSKALQRKTEAQYQDAINKGVAAELDTPARRKLIGDAIKSELATRMAGRILAPSQGTTIAESLRSVPDGQIYVRPGAVGEEQHYGSLLSLAMRASPSWKDHVSYAAPGSWEGLTAAGDETLEFLGGTCGIAIVVKDVGNPPRSARQLEAALKAGGVANVRLSTCGCTSPPKPTDIWL